jgi:catechol 2,3-dioxygenase-like lactoylglutathione lyase family enzyme
MLSMLDHVSLRVADYERSKRFYAAALAPLGFTLARESASGAGFRRDAIPVFWIKQGDPGTGGAGLEPPEPAGCGGPAIHVAFASPDRATVDAFYRAALAAGGRDHGAPRVCPEYHAHYYGGFVLDLDGHNIEAVCHMRE